MSFAFKSLVTTVNKGLGSARMASRSGLIAHFIFGTDFATSKTNHAGGADLTASGAATYGAGYAQVSSVVGSSTGFTANVFPVHDMTLIVIWSNLNGIGRCPVFATDLSNFCGFLNAATNSMDAYNTQNGLAPNVAAVAMPASNSYYLQAARLPAEAAADILKGVNTAGVLSLTKVTAGVAGGPAVGSVRGTSSFVIGTSVFGQGQANIAIREIMLFNRLQDDSEILATYTKQTALIGAALL